MLALAAADFTVVLEGAPLSEAAIDRREFLKVWEAMVAEGGFSHLGAGQQPAEPRENWAGNLNYSTAKLYTPATVAEVQQVVAKCAKVRALGSRHSFNTIADSTVAQVSLKQLDTIEIDEKARTVTLGAGVNYGKLAQVVDSKGFALHNLASLPHISVAGAIATATHGSGLHNGNLATAVVALEMVTAEGKMVTLVRGKDERFAAAVVGLGAPGIVTHVTLDLQPAFQMAQSVYENLSFDWLKDHFDEIFGAGYSVSLFTDLQNHRATQVWIKRRVAAGDAYKWELEFFGAKLAKEKLHPIARHPAESCTEQQGIAGSWYERLPHFQMNFTPSSGRELQSEYFVPREHAFEAITAVEQLRDKITPHLFVTEFRTIAADDLWMSMAHKRDALAIHFTFKPEEAAVRALLPQIEAKLERFHARPHWGKLFAVPPAKLQSLYAKMNAFKGYLKEIDPQGKFRNEFLDVNLYSA